MNAETDLQAELAKAETLARWGWGCYIASMMVVGVLLWVLS